MDVQEKEKKLINAIVGMCDKEKREQNPIQLVEYISELINTPCGMSIQEWRDEINKMYVDIKAGKYGDLMNNPDPSYLYSCMDQMSLPPLTDDIINVVNSAIVKAIPEYQHCAPGEYYHVRDVFLRIDRRSNSAGIFERKLVKASGRNDFGSKIYVIFIGEPDKEIQRVFVEIFDNEIKLGLRLEAIIE